MARSSLHLNGNILCAVDVETTGFVPGYHDIWQIAVLPLDSECKPSIEYPPFYMDMAVKRPENITKEAIKLSKVDFARKQQTAIDPWSCSDLFDEWFQRMKLPNYKRLVPLAQNWPFDRAFIQEWLGIETFSQLFSPHYRDTMAAAIFLMDLADRKCEKIHFTQYNLSYLCNKLGVTNLKAHDALQDCIATAEVYRRILQWAM